MSFGSNNYFIVGCKDVVVATKALEGFYIISLTASATTTLSCFIY